MKNETTISRVAARFRWHARKGGGLSVGIRVDFPVTSIFDNGEIRPLVRINVGFLVASLSVEFRGRVTRMIDFAKPNNTCEKYDELLFAVSRVVDGESRHDTALRYIREMEAFSGKTSFAEMLSMLDWAETIICNAAPMPHCTQEQWNNTVLNWRDQKNHIRQLTGSAGAKQP